MVKIGQMRSAQTDEDCTINTHGVAEPERVYSLYRGPSGMFLGIPYTYNGEKNSLAVDELIWEEIEDIIHQKQPDKHSQEWYIMKLQSPNGPYGMERAKVAAQLTAQWMLPQRERADIEMISQRQLGEYLGKTQASISQWLNPLKEKNTLRHTLGTIKNGTRPSEEDISRIDKIENRITYICDNDGEIDTMVDTLKEIDIDLEELEEYVEYGSENSRWDCVFLSGILTDEFSPSSNELRRIAEEVGVSIT